MLYKCIDIDIFCQKHDIRLKYYNSGTYGHIFQAISTHSDKILFGVKMIPNSQLLSNISTTDSDSAVTAEMLILQTLSELDGPYYVKPSDMFYSKIYPFVTGSTYIEITDNTAKYQAKFVDKYEKARYWGEVNAATELSDNINFTDSSGVEKKYCEYVGIIVYPWHDTDLLACIQTNTMDLDNWICVLFQVVASLAIIHNKYPSFRHNSLKPNDILINHICADTLLSTTIFGKTYQFKNPKYQVKLWDFNFSSIDSLVNNSLVESIWTKQLNINCYQHQYYDIYMFLVFIRKICADGYNINIPTEINEFINRVIPEQHYLNSTNRCRFLDHIEYITPMELLSDPLFEPYIAR